MIAQIVLFVVLYLVLISFSINALNAIDGFISEPFFAKLFSPFIFVVFFVVFISSFLGRLVGTGLKKLDRLFH